MDYKMINQQIEDLKRLLSSDKLSPEERQNYFDTLTFLLDTRALINTKALKENSN